MNYEFMITVLLISDYVIAVKLVSEKLFKVGLYYLFCNCVQKTKQFLFFTLPPPLLPNFCPIVKE